MIQKRHRIRISCEGHPTIITICMELTGEYGLTEATKPALLKAYDLWKESLDEWVASGKSLESSGHVEFLTEEWRISEVGERAKTDVEIGKGDLVQAFVDREGEHEYRGPVRGAGRLLSLEKAEKSASIPPEVSLSNWNEGAKQFAAMFAPMMQAFAAQHANAAKDPIADDPGSRHSDDFASVHWFGADYTFTKSQRPVVETLWIAWKNKTPSVAKDTLIDKSGTTGDRLDLVFRDHPAWGVMIVRDGQDTYRLAVPKP